LFPGIISVEGSEGGQQGGKVIHHALREEDGPRKGAAAAERAGGDVAAELLQLCILLFETAHQSLLMHVLFVETADQRLHLLLKLLLEGREGGMARRLLLAAERRMLAFVLDGLAAGDAGGPSGEKGAGSKDESRQLHDR